MSKIAATIFFFVGMGASKCQCPAQDADPFVGSADARTLTEKMSKLIFPSIRFEGATLEEAVEYLRVKSRDLDTQEARSKRKGVNVIVRNADDKRTAPLISLDLKDVSMIDALRRVMEMSGCTYRVGFGEVVVSSNAFKGQERPRPPVKVAGKTVKTQISAQVAEFAQGKTADSAQTTSGQLILPREDVADSRHELAPGQFELEAVLTEPQRQVILKGLAQKKHLTLHPPESKIVQDEVEAAFQGKDLPSLKVLVEESADVNTVDAQMTLFTVAGKRCGSISVSLWNGQTVLLKGLFVSQDGLPRVVRIFVTAMHVDEKGGPLPESRKP